MKPFLIKAFHDPRPFVEKLKEFGFVDGNPVSFEYAMETLIPALFTSGINVMLQNLKHDSEYNIMWLDVYRFQQR